MRGQYEPPAQTHDVRFQTEFNVRNRSDFRYLKSRQGFWAETYFHGEYWRK